MSTEKQQAIALANRLLNEPNADPDDELRLLSRQFLRAREIIEKQEKALQAVDWNGQAELDLIHSNRDQMLKMHEEAVRRIRKSLVSVEIHDSQTIDIMHCESWFGWPKESK